MPRSYEHIRKYEKEILGLKAQGKTLRESGDYCYMVNQTVETIILPDTVKLIDAYAFANCPNLKKVISPGVEYCGKQKRLA